MRVFLTGGTGLLGSHTAEALAAAGHQVVALARPTADAAALAGVAQVVRGDVLDPPARLESLMRGCDAVVHAAALLYRRGARRAEYERLNVVATESLLRAAGAAGVGRAVHVSSIAVYAPAAEASAYSEESWLDGALPARMSYAITKRAGEAAAWRVHAEGRVRLTTVRPGVLYGERDRWLTPPLARVVRLPVVPLPGGGRTTVPVVYAGNVARGIVAALGRDATVGRAYNLSDDGGLTSRELLMVFGETVGRAPRIVTIPGTLLVAAAAVGDVVARIFGANLRRAARRLLDDNRFSSERARRELGWTQEGPAALVPPTQAVVRTAEWWRSSRPNPR